MLSVECRRINKPIIKGADVRFGALSDISAVMSHVRFAPESGRRLNAVPCPLGARSGHLAAHSIISADGRLALDGA